MFRYQLLGRLDHLLTDLGTVHGISVSGDCGKFRRLLHGSHHQNRGIVNAAARKQFIIKGTGDCTQNADFLILFQTYFDHGDLRQAGGIYRDIQTFR